VIRIQKGERMIETEKFSPRHQVWEFSPLGASNCGDWRFAGDAVKARIPFASQSSLADLFRRIGLRRMC
jgi:hypothetical protein